MLGLLAGAIYLPYYFVHNPFFHENFCETGQIGDSIGGTVGPAVAIIGALLTFLAFYVQYQANQQQRKDIDSQGDNWLYERFESRFFELLRLHKENVVDMQMGPYIGRKCFSILFEEFRLIYEIVLFLRVELSRKDPEYENIDILKVAYHCFFYGINNHGAKAFMEDFKGVYRSFYEREDGIFQTLERSKLRTSIPPENRIEGMINEWFEKYDYIPFGGHGDMLGHYYRHLYQTVNYIVNDKEILEAEEKVEFIRTFRAQLTNSEQLMLFYNGAIWFPEEWRKIFTMYRFIKNIPLELCELGLTPFVLYEEEMIKLYVYEDGKKMFEGQGDINGMVTEWRNDNPDWEKGRKEYFKLKGIKDPTGINS